MKFILLILIQLFCSCSLLTTKENQLSHNIFQLNGHNKDNTFNKCNSFLISPNEIVTANHCITNQLNLSYITVDNTPYFFDSITEQNETLDILHLKLKKSIEINIPLDEADSISANFYIGLIKNDKISIINCQSQKDDIIIPHGKCDNEIKKGYSGAVILNDQMEYVGVLIGVDKIDTKIVYFSPI